MRHMSASETARALAQQWLHAEADLAEPSEQEERACAFGMMVRITRYVITSRRRGRDLVLALLNGCAWARKSTELERWTMKAGRCIKGPPKTKEATP